MRILVWSPQITVGRDTSLLHLVRAITRQTEIEQVQVVVPEAFKANPVILNETPKLVVLYIHGDMTCSRVKDFSADCDVVYFHWPHEHEYNRIDKPSICLFHDTTLIDYVPPFASGSQIKKYWTQSEKWVHGCNSVIVPSRYVQGRLRELFGIKKASVISAPVLEETVMSAEVSPSPIPDSSLLYPANLCYHKNHYGLLLAYAKFKYRKQHPLVLLGTDVHLLDQQPPNWPEPPLVPTLISLIKRTGLKVNDDLYLIRFKDNQELVSAIQHAKAVLMPAYSDGERSFPVEVALRLGTPVLAADIPAMREQLAARTAKIGWFQAESPDSITNGLEDLIDHYDAYKASTIEGINDPLETWDNVAKKYIQEFRRAYFKYHGHNVAEGDRRLVETCERKSTTQIGLFLLYPGPVNLDVEGIGRFIIRLSEGLLRRQNVSIHIATNAANIKNVQSIFETQRLTYPERLSIYCSDHVDTINQNVQVDTWIVPYVGLERALLLKKPFILCLHDLIHRHFPDMYYHKYPDFFKQIDRVADSMAARAAAVVFSSEFIRNNEGLKFLGLQAEKTHVVRLAPPSEEYRTFNSYSEKTFREKYKLVGDYVTFPSAIRLHKNHDRLIEAFLKFKQTSEGKKSGLKLVFTDQYTSGPKSEEIANVLRVCKNKQDALSVVFLGRIPSQDVAPLYQYAVGTIVPTLFEGSCPFPILESLLVNTPVAISDLEVAREVIADMDAFITFNPYSIDEMALAIAQLYEKSSSLAEKQRASIRTVLLRTWADVADEYYAVIERVLQSHRQGRELT